jgi:predicted glutamate--cysteine ligase
LVKQANQNEQAVARHSLEAQLTHWENSQVMSAQDWVRSLYQEVWPVAKRHGFSCFLSPIQALLREGNTAQQWLQRYQQGLGSRQILQQAIQEMAQQEQDLEDKICQTLAA